MSVEAHVIDYEKEYAIRQVEKILRSLRADFSVFLKEEIELLIEEKPHLIDDDYQVDESA